METIESTAELAAVSGGANNPYQNVRCTVSAGPNGGGVECSTDLQTFMEISFRAFDQLQAWGGEFGGWLYDVTHSPNPRRKK